jgi:hypothetical protein
LVGILNRDAPQSRQTEIVGNTWTPGLASWLGAERWIIISVVNSDWFSEEQREQDIKGHSLMLNSTLDGKRRCPPAGAKSQMR